MWSHTNLTPFERPAEIETFIITAAQAAAIKAKIDARNDDLSRPAESSIHFDERRVERVGGQLRSSVIVDPPSGMLPGNGRFKEVVAEAKGALLTAFDGPEQRPTSERCLAAVSAGPPALLIPSSDLRQIVQTPTSIVIASEEVHEARVVRLNAPQGPSAIQTWLGDSVGYWENDTLVIVTTSFAPQSAVRAGPNGLYLLSPAARVEERLTRIAHDELLYQFSVTDPVYYTQTWRGETHFLLTEARQIEYACHEGNYSLTFALQAARVLEQDKAPASRDPIGDQSSAAK